MSGLAQLTLTDKELARLTLWYLAHYLAGENSAADDELADRVLAAYEEVECRTTTTTSRKSSPTPTS